MYYVYILYSKKVNSYYKGFTANLHRRVKQHNNGESKYTSKANDWHPVHIEQFTNKSDALRREKILKKYDHQQINRLKLSPKNQLDDYLNK